MEESGRLSDRADEFLSRCRETADPDARGDFVEECSAHVVEVKTPPVGTVADLSREYLSRLDLALRRGAEMGVRLYPLAAYPLPMAPRFRPDPSYEIQAKTVGRERFVHAGRCTGTHLHLELPAGTVDPSAVISEDLTEAAAGELLNLYNLATALDPALISLTRSSPFYEGEAPGLAVRTAHYRGSSLFGWKGVYARLPEIGGLRPYAKSPRDLAARQLAGYHGWLKEMRRAGVDPGLFARSGGDVLSAYWGPVRIGSPNTVELRGIDSNHPRPTLAVVDLIRAAAARVRDEGLTVEPGEDAPVFEVRGGKLVVPGFAYLSEELFYAAVAGAPDDPAITAYLDALTDFCAPYLEDPHTLKTLKPGDGSYATTESRLLQEFAAPGGVLPEGEGLRLVRESCDELEAEISELLDRPGGRQPV